MSDINALRAHLFDALQAVKNGSISIEQAKAVSEIGQTIINSAKLEVDYCKATGGSIIGGFIKPEDKQLPSGVVSIRTHKLRG